MNDEDINFIQELIKNKGQCAGGYYYERCKNCFIKENGICTNTIAYKKAMGLNIKLLMDKI